MPDRKDPALSKNGKGTAGNGNGNGNGSGNGKGNAPATKASKGGRLRYPKVKTG